MTMYATPTRPRRGRVSDSAPASPAQTGFIASLLERREVDPGISAELTRELEAGTVTKGQASTYITYLKKQPWKQTNTDPVTQPGYYEADGAIFKVQTSRSSGRLYAMQWDADEERWFYLAGVVYRLHAAERVSKERAAQLGAKAARDPR